MGWKARPTHLAASHASLRKRASVRWLPSEPVAHGAQVEFLGAGVPFAGVIDAVEPDMIAEGPVVILVGHDDVVLVVTVDVTGRYPAGHVFDIEWPHDPRVRDGQVGERQAVRGPQVDAH